MKKQHLQKTVLSAMFLALGMVLPLLTMQIKDIGNALLPMHIPVMLCGIICGWQYGLAVGMVLPFLRSFVFGMPLLYPQAVWMSAELLTYGLIIGLLYKKLPKNTLCLYVSLISSQIIGRIVWAIAKFIILGFSGQTFTFAMFITDGFVEAILGIILQLILIPFIVSLFKLYKRG